MSYVDIDLDEKECYNKIKVYTDDGMFFVSFERNLDLYIGYLPDCNFLESPNKKVIKITRENNFLYNCFDKVYNSVKNKCPYKNGYVFDDEEKNLKYNNDFLFIDDKIMWYSDDYSIDEASLLVISKIDDYYELEFNKSKNKTFAKTFFVRFRNSGSRYDPYNVTFMNMYKELLKCDNQICFEDIIYLEGRKKMLKK